MDRLWDCQPVEPRTGRDQASVRAHNLALVLQLVEQYPGSSRATVATASGLTRATVSSLVETLSGWGFVQETGRALAPAGAGRPGTALALAPHGAAGLGIEVNVDYVATAVVDLTGAVTHRTVDAADQRGRAPEEVLAAAAELAATTLRAARADGLRVVGTRVAVPGLVRAADGTLVVAPNLGWEDVPVVDLLRRDEALRPLPTRLDNEADCAARGELRTRDARSSFLYVSGEIGVGAALVVDGTILRGTHGWSGELGHVTVDPDGPPCSCGANGCLEQYAGQEAVLRAAGDAGAATTAHAPAPSIDRIVALAREGSAPIERALHDAGTALGIALASAVNLLDVTEIVLGGSFRSLAPWLTADVERELARRVVSRRYVDLVVRASSRSTDAAVVGAAASVVREVVDEPAAWAPDSAAAVPQ